MKQAFVRRDRHIVDRGMPLRHVTVSIKGPIFVAMGAKPLARRVVIFVTKTHGYFVIAVGPDFLDQPIAVFRGLLFG